MQAERHNYWASGALGARLGLAYGGAIGLAIGGVAGALVGAICGGMSPGFARVSVAI